MSSAFILHTFVNPVSVATRAACSCFDFISILVGFSALIHFRPAKVSCVQYQSPRRPNLPCFFLPHKRQSF